jgi:hypothetical protein
MSGRYDKSEKLTYDGDGTRVTYLAPRILPTAPPAAATTTIQRDEQHRLDLVANRTLGNPELAWQIADANDAMDPFDLCDHTGQTIDLPGSSL